MRAQISGQPVDVVSSDRHTVKPWLAGKLPVTAMVVDLAPEGFELLGGRIDIVGGNPAPTLVYKHRQHLVSVTQLRANIADYPATPRRKTLDGYPVAIWKYDAGCNHADGIASMDLFVVPTLSFQLLYGLLILCHGRRQIYGWE